VLEACQFAICKKLFVKTMRSEKIVVFRTFKVAEKIDLFRAQCLFQQSDVCCYAENQDRYLIARADGLTAKIFPNGRLVVATNTLKNPDLTSLLHILKKASRGGLLETKKIRANKSVVETKRIFKRAQGTDKRSGLHARNVGLASPERKNRKHSKGA